MCLTLSHLDAELSDDHIKALRQILLELCDDTTKKVCLSLGSGRRILQLPMQAVVNATVQRVVGTQALQHTLAIGSRLDLGARRELMAEGRGVGR